MRRLTALCFTLASVLGFVRLGLSDEPAKRPPVVIPDGALVMVVMDPLAAPLSCPCVQGYAQRDYDKLAAYLTEELRRPVAVTFHESLVAVLQKETRGRADIVIGKHSVVLSDAKRANLSLQPTLALSGKDGQTEMTGLFVVPAADPAQSLADLKGYRIIFGTPECDEKYAAPIKLLQQTGVRLPKELETCAACSDGATKILELGKDVRAATIISSYAAPLLEGCGTIKKGDLRVVGTTPTVPFVEAFLNDKLPSTDQKAIRTALLKMGTRSDLMEALESQLGFLPLSPQKKRSS